MQLLGILFRLESGICIGIVGHSFGCGLFLWVTVWVWHISCVRIRVIFLGWTLRLKLELQSGLEILGQTYGLEFAEQGYFCGFKFV